VNFAKKNFINVNVHENGYYQKIEVLDMKKSMFLGFLLIASLFFVFGCAPTEEVSIADGSVFTGDASFGGVTGLIIGGKSRVKTKCVDSDGKKVHVKGNVYTKRVLGGRVLSSTPVKHDVCVSQSTVKEYFCKGKKVKYKTVTCKNGCSDGACRRKFVGVKSCNYAWTDEYRCEGDKLQRAWTTSRCDKKWSKRQKCEYGCSNDTCNPEPAVGNSDCPARGFVPETSCNGNVLVNKSGAVCGNSVLNTQDCTTYGGECLEASAFGVSPENVTGNLNKVYYDFASREYVRGDAFCARYGAKVCQNNAGEKKIIDARWDCEDERPVGTWTQVGTA
jgi:hypothetical protein